MDDLKGIGQFQICSIWVDLLRLNFLNLSDKSRQSLNQMIHHRRLRLELTTERYDRDLFLFVVLRFCQVFWLHFSNYEKNRIRLIKYLKVQVVKISNHSHNHIKAQKQNIKHFSQSKAKLKNWHEVPFSIMPLQNNIFVYHI